MNNRLLIGLIILGWIIISFLFCRCHYLSQKLEIAEQNIISLKEHKQAQANAYQIRYRELRDSLHNKEISKNTLSVVKVKETVRTTDTLLISIEDTIFAKDFHLDTVLHNDWRYMHIKIEPSDGVLRLSDSLSLQSGLTYRIDKRKVLKRNYKTWFGNKVWGPVFGKKMNIHTVYMQTDNPLIHIDSTSYFELY